MPAPCPPVASLLQQLQAVAQAEGGSISIEDFLREAAFHPRFGYYSGGKPGLVGRGGDFATSATLHPALGRAIAAWAWQCRSSVKVGAAAHWHLIELGGGGGQLASALLASLGLWRRRGLRYHLVEISAGLREEQSARLATWAGRVRWHADVASALRSANGRALIFSNEFVDAFPCVQLVRDRRVPAGWREVRLSWHSGLDSAREVLAPARDSRLTHGGENLPSVCRPGAADILADDQRVEIHFAYRDWLAESLVPHWQSGRLLTIDYGDTFPELYHRRPRGTLRAYTRHTRIEPGDPAVFSRPGQQDLTADVNFTDLQNWGRALGLREAGPLCTLRDFLLRWLPPACHAAAACDEHLALKFLLDPLGAGGAFRVLEQTRAAAA